MTATDAEVGLLGALLESPALASSVLEIVAPQDFTDWRLGRVLVALEGLERLSLPELAETLERAHPKQGWPELLARLVDEGDVPANAQRNAVVVRMQALTRERAALLSELLAGPRAAALARVGEIDALLEGRADGPSADDLHSAILAERLHATVVADIFDADGMYQPPPNRRFVIDGLVPRGVPGLMIGAGGGGKGMAEIVLGIHLALGRDICGHQVRDPMGVVLLSAEDDAHEMQRRLIHTLAALGYTNLSPLCAEDRALLVRNLHLFDFVGTDSDLRDPRTQSSILERLRQVEDLGVVFLDSLGLWLPPTAEAPTFNGPDFAVAARKVASQITTETGATPTWTYHTSKAARRNKADPEATDALGAVLLTDYSRIVLSLAPLSASQADERRLDSRESYLQIIPTKSNYGPVGEKHALLFRRGEMGVLVPVDAAEIKAQPLAEMPMENTPGELGLVVGEMVSVSRIVKALTGSDARPNGRQRDRGDRLVHQWYAQGLAITSGTSWKIIATGPALEEPFAAGETGRHPGDIWETRLPSEIGRQGDIPL